MKGVVRKVSKDSQPESGVYRITNTVDGKVYIGQALNLERRFACHRSALRLGAHPNRRLQVAWNREGEAAFRFEVAMYITDARCLNSAEEGWFYLTKCCERKYGYNTRRDARTAPPRRDVRGTRP